MRRTRKKTFGHTFVRTLAVSAFALFSADELRAQGNNGGSTFPATVGADQPVWYWETFPIPSALNARGVITNAAGWGFNVKITDSLAKHLEIGNCDKAPDAATTLDFTGDIEDGFIMTSTRDYHDSAIHGNNNSLLSSPGHVNDPWPAFDFKAKANALVLPDTLVDIGARAFAQCDGLKGALSIPNGVTNIGYAAFYQCTGFTGTLSFPDSVVTISDQAFGGTYTGNSTVLFGSSVASIGGYTFNGCMFTNHVVIPASVTNLGVGAFQALSRVPSVTFLGAKPTTVGTGLFGTVSTLTIYVYHAYCAGWEADTGGTDANKFSGDFAYLSARWRNNKIICIGHPLVVYTVQFDNGFGARTMPEAIFACNVLTNLPASTYYRTGYLQNGWTNAVPGGLWYGNEATIATDIANAGDTVVLTALWTPITYAISVSASPSFESPYYNVGGNVYGQDWSLSWASVAAGAFLAPGEGLLGLTNIITGAFYEYGETYRNLANTQGSVVNLYLVIGMLPPPDYEWVNVTQITLDGTDVTLEWDARAISVPNYTYEIWTTTDLNAPFALAYEEAALDITVLNRTTLAATVKLVAEAEAAPIKFFKVKAVQ